MINLEAQQIWELNRFYENWNEHQNEQHRMAELENTKTKHDYSISLSFNWK